MSASRSFRFARSQAGPQIFIALRPWREPVDERSQVKTRTPGDYRKPPATCDFPEHGSADPCKIARREQFAGIRNIDQVVGNLPALFARQLGRSDIEQAVNLD